MKPIEYYFSHDVNAHDDPKCVLLIDDMGMEGYGIFWLLLEILRNQPNYRCPLCLISPYSKRYNTTKDKMMHVIKDFNLFMIDNQENFYSSSLDSRMEVYNNLREKRRQAGIASGKHRRKNTTSERTKNNTCSTSVQEGSGFDELKKKIKENKNKRISLLEIEEIERIFNIFYLKNFQEPEIEIERFLGNYESQGWTKSNGQPIKDLIALANNWTQKDKNATVRFPKKYIMFLKDIISKVPKEPVKTLTNIKDFKIDYNGKKLLIAAPCYTVDFFKKNTKIILPLLNKYYNNYKLYFKTI